MSNDYKLTTIDNPFSPFDQFDSWHLFDKEKGYDSCERLMRLANITDEMSSVEIEQELERAMDTLIKYDFLNLFQKCQKTDKFPLNGNQNHT